MACYEDNDWPLTTEWLHDTAGTNTAFYNTGVEILLTGEGLNFLARGRWYLWVSRPDRIGERRALYLKSETEHPPYQWCRIFVGYIGTRGEFRRYYQQFAMAYWDTTSPQGGKGEA